MFKISVSDVTFKDGGKYTCSQSGQTTMKKKTVAVTVLGELLLYEKYLVGIIIFQVIIYLIMTNYSYYMPKILI